jgi:hypothetical protein
VHQYNPNSDKGDNNSNGVYLYRKSFFNKEGGYLKIDNSKMVGKIYVGNLNDLYFGPSKDPCLCSVPIEEQDCEEFTDKNQTSKEECNGNETKSYAKGDCIKHKCPTLASENITSIEIKGNYVVMLVYFDSKTDSEMLWTYCQEYPLPNDINKNGPKQIKWDAIRNKGVLPNWVVIIPVVEK